jgi:hypothetical protein
MFQLSADCSKGPSESYAPPLTTLKCSIIRTYAPHAGDCEIYAYACRKAFPAQSLPVEVSAPKSHQLATYPMIEYMQGAGNTEETPRSADCFPG